MRAAALLLAALLVPRHVAAQDWLVLESLYDVEGWVTDTGSTLLTRNNGGASWLGRARLWAGVDVRGVVQIVAQGRFEAGPAVPRERETEIEQLVLRLLPARVVIVEAGRFPSPVGRFSGRRLSPDNPLIGSPDLYPVEYPWGVQVRGAASALDYRVAVVNRPASHPGYQPRPSSRARVAAGVGVTPTVGVRLGGSITWGPYLNDSVPPGLLAGQEWPAYHQRVVGADLALSRGHLETHIEMAWSEYEVPGLPEPLRGLGAYLEITYTLSPRFFTAARIERHRYPFIRAFGPQWTASTVIFSNGELGVGFRLYPRSLAKLSLRLDDWAPGAFSSDAYAVALQVSHHIDWVALFSR
jgi:hypothetical protein